MVVMSRIEKNSTVVIITGVTYRYGCREMVNRYQPRHRRVSHYHGDHHTNRKISLWFSVLTSYAQKIKSTIIFCHIDDDNTKVFSPLDIIMLFDNNRAPECSHYAMAATTTYHQQSSSSSL